MKSRLPDVPVLRADQCAVSGQAYNVIRLAVSRLGRPLVKVLGERGLDLWLNEEAWVCYDRKLHYRPVVAWTGFRPQERSSLAAAVPCRLLHYHPYGRVVVHTVLDELAGKLAEQLRRHPLDRPRTRIYRLERFRPTAPRA